MVRRILGGIWIIGVFTLCGCAMSAHIPEVKVKKPIQPAAEKEIRPIQFKKIVFKLPRGEVIGSVQQGPFCVGRYKHIWRGGRRVVSAEELTEAFREELERSGYTVVGDPYALFDDPSTWKAQYLVAGLVRDLKTNICYPRFGWGDNYSISGESYLEVEWQVFSRLERKVVYKTTTKGTFDRDEPIADDGFGLIVGAFAIAVNNLLADQGFHDQMHGPSAGERMRREWERLVISAPEYIHYPAKTKMVAIRAGVVTVYAGSGHGSGFIISPEGHILTNKHVVGGADKVRIKLNEGKVLEGRVMRRISRPDVALVKVEAQGLSCLYVNRQNPLIGDEVFALGSPLRDDLSGTVSRGIVSALRFINGQNLVQCDINVQPGNSGGPLVNQEGAVIGMTMSGISIGGAPAGLNFFIPINDALSALSIDLGR